MYRRRSQCTDGEAKVQAEKPTYRRRSPCTGGEAHVQTEKPMYRRRSPCTGEEANVQAEKPMYRRRRCHESKQAIAQVEKPPGRQGSHHTGRQATTQADKPPYRQTSHRASREATVQADKPQRRQTSCPSVVPPAGQGQPRGRREEWGRWVPGDSRTRSPACPGLPLSPITIFGEGRARGAAAAARTLPGLLPCRRVPRPHRHPWGDGMWPQIPPEPQLSLSALIWSWGAQPSNSSSSSGLSLRWGCSPRSGKPRGEIPGTGGDDVLLLHLPARYLPSPYWFPSPGRWEDWSHSGPPTNTNLGTGHSHVPNCRYEVCNQNLPGQHQPLGLRG